MSITGNGATGNLTLSGTAPKLQADSITNTAGTGSPVFPNAPGLNSAVLNDTTAAVTILSTDTTRNLTLSFSGAVTVNLPAVASSIGRMITIKKITANGTVTIDPSGGELIDGSATNTQIRLTNDALVIFCDGLTWMTSTVNVQRRHQIRLHTQNAYGSTDTAIAQFSTEQENVGSAMTYVHANAGVNGTKVTINEAGLYSFTFGHVRGTTANIYFGLSLNSTQLTTIIVSITTADRLIVGIAGLVDTPSVVSWTGFLAAGDIVRAHVEIAGTTSASANRAHFTATKIG